jgi:hypothetical protein
LDPAGARLGASLLRLNRGIEQARKDEARVESMFGAWQKQWSSRREIIAYRLEMIESQLARLVPPEERKASKPQLVVFSSARDPDDVTVTGRL